jgi:hypothetical protein
MIKPVVRDVLTLAKVARAQRLLESKRVDGYLVCEPWIKSKNRAVYLWFVYMYVEVEKDTFIYFGAGDDVRQMFGFHTSFLAFFVALLT